MSQEKTSSKTGFHLFHPAEAYFEEPIQDAKKRTPNWFIHFAKWVIRPVIRAMFRIRVLGRENIPKPGNAAVFVANHVSFADPPVLWVVTPPTITRFMARSNLWRIKILGAILSRAGAMPVDPESADLKAVKRAAAALKRGECVGIFAEGTRMKDDDKVYVPHAGFVLMAKMGKAPIIPVGITGTDRIAPPGKKLWRLPKVTITFGEPFELSKFDDVPKEERTQAVVDYTMEQVFCLRDAADPAPIRLGLPPYGFVPGVDDPSLDPRLKEAGHDQA